jgi:hypothetical protein
MYALIARQILFRLFRELQIAAKQGTIKGQRQGSCFLKLKVLASLLAILGLRLDFGPAAN